MKVTRRFPRGTHPQMHAHTRTHGGHNLCSSPGRSAWSIWAAPPKVRSPSCPPGAGPRVPEPGASSPQWAGRRRGPRATAPLGHSGDAASGEPGWRSGPRLPAQGHELAGLRFLNREDSRAAAHSRVGQCWLALSPGQTGGAGAAASPRISNPPVDLSHLEGGGARCGRFKCVL